MTRPAVRPARKQIRVCFVGDSYVNGTGDPACLGWTGRICVAAQREDHDVTYYNLGVRRDTTDDIVRRWSEEVHRRLPTDTDGRVVFSFGVNAAIEQDRRRVDIATSVSNARVILLTAQQRYPTLVVDPPPVADPRHTERTSELSRKLGSICGELNIAYLETYASLLCTEACLREVAAYDGSHPRASGYEALSDLVQQWPAWKQWFS